MYEKINQGWGSGSGKESYLFKLLDPYPGVKISFLLKKGMTNIFKWLFSHFFFSQENNTILSAVQNSLKWYKNQRGLLNFVENVAFRTTGSASKNSKMRMNRGSI
jgi:hypothetical protein